MKEAEYWILEAVVDGRWALLTLRPDAVEEAYNRDGHGLTDAQLLETLNGLFRQGYLWAYQDEPPGSGDTISGPFVPSEARLRSILGEWQPVWYGLTPKGGAEWERLSRPDWQRFIYSLTSVDEPQCTLYCASRQMAEKFFARDDVRNGVVQSTVRWERKEPWDATYWKTLASGYEVSFEFRVPDPDDFPHAEPPDDWYSQPTF